MIRILLVILLSTVAGASPSWAENGTASGDPTRPIQMTARIEVACRFSKRRDPFELRFSEPFPRGRKVPQNLSPLV